MQDKPLNKELTLYLNFILRLVRGTGISQNSFNKASKLWSAPELVLSCSCLPVLLLTSKRSLRNAPLDWTSTKLESLGER